MVIDAIDFREFFEVIAQLRIIAFSDPDLDAVLVDILSLQEKLLIERHSAVPQIGFLISAFDLVEARGLVMSGAKLLVSYAGKKLVGFAVTTPIQHFTHLFDLKEGSSFEPHSPVDFDSLDYLYQLAVDPEFIGLGFGRELLERAKGGGKALLADVLIEPVNNASSITFFEKNGFHEVGVLSLGAYRDFGALESRVYVWKP